MCLEHAGLAACEQTHNITCAPCTDVSQKQQAHYACAAKLIFTCMVNMSGNFGHSNWGHKLLQFPDREIFFDRKGRTCLRKSRCTLALVKIEMKTENTPDYQGQCLAAFSFFGKTE